MERGDNERITMEKQEGEIVSNFFIAQRKYKEMGFMLVDGGGGFYVYNLDDWNECCIVKGELTTKEPKPDPNKLSGKPSRYFDTLNDLASYLEGFADGKIGRIPLEEYESEEEDGNQEESKEGKKLEAEGGDRKG